MVDNNKLKTYKYRTIEDSPYLKIQAEEYKIDKYNILYFCLEGRVVGSARQWVDVYEVVESQLASGTPKKEPATPPQTLDSLLSTLGKMVEKKYGSP